MRIAKKRIELGDMTFCLGIDRNISAEVFEKYPDAILKQSEVGDKKAEILGDEKEYSVYELAKEGKLTKILKIENDLKELIRACVSFALPSMLEKAGEDKNIAKTILDFVEEYNIDEFYDAVWSFIIVGFTGEGQEEQKRPMFKMT